MHVFKQTTGGSTTRSRRTPATSGSSLAARERYTSPAAQNPHSTHLASESTVSYPWGESNVPVAMNSPTYNTYANMQQQQQQVGTSPSTYPTTATPATGRQWLVAFNGQNQMFLPATQGYLPNGYCGCNTQFRFIHLPTISGIPGMQVPFGVLWSFVVTTGAGWFEGRGTNNCVSQVNCPVCNMSIAIYPYGM